MPLAALTRASDRIVPPWPRLMITCGRRSVPYALFVRRASGGHTFTIHIQNPLTSLARFDLVAVPMHDNLSGDNVINTIGALHHVTPARLTAAARQFAPLLSRLPRPLVAVLLGGSNRCYRLTNAIIQQIAVQLRSLADQGFGLAVAPSRRTDGAIVNALKGALIGRPTLIQGIKEPNPYLGFLALADAILVTSDSVSMVSEAVATKKPVHVIELPGGNSKFRSFHQTMREHGFTRPFQGNVEYWSYEPPDDTATVAACVAALMADTS